MQQPIFQLLPSGLLGLLPSLGQPPFRSHVPVTDDREKIKGRKFHAATETKTIGFSLSVPNPLSAPKALAHSQIFSW